MVWVTYEVKIEVKMGICLCYAGMPESLRIKVIKLALYLVVWFPSPCLAPVIEATNFVASMTGERQG